MKKILISLLLAFILIPQVSALTTGESSIIFGSIFTILISVVFFLVLSIMSRNVPAKLFLLSLAALCLVASIGISVSVMQEHFPDFEILISTYSSLYFLGIILLIAGSFALILWLVYVAFTSFYSYRGIGK